MSTDSNFDRIKAAVHRRAGRTPPQIDAIVAEVRTPDNLGIQPPDMTLALYGGFSLMIEWTFAVAYSDLEGFHKFLKANEDNIAKMSSDATHENGRYLGTWWVSGIGPSIYRTLWQYKSEQAIQNLKDGLTASPNFGNAVKVLRSFWAKDPGRVEQRYQPAALFTDLKAASAIGGQPDPLVALALGP